MVELFDLQLFAESELDEPTAEGEGAKEPAKEPELKYTDEDVDRIISEKFAKWQKKQEAKLTEAQKLANMPAEAAAFDAFEQKSESIPKFV